MRLISGGQTGVDSAARRPKLSTVSASDQILANVSYMSHVRTVPAADRRKKTTVAMCRR